MLDFPHDESLHLTEMKMPGYHHRQMYTFGLEGSAEAAGSAGWSGSLELGSGGLICTTGLE
jgi:hypothetical protein